MKPSLIVPVFFMAVTLFTFNTAQQVQAQVTEGEKSVTESQFGWHHRLENGE